MNMGLISLNVQITKTRPKILYKLSKAFQCMLNNFKNSMLLQKQISSYDGEYSLVSGNVQVS